MYLIYFKHSSCILFFSDAFGCRYFHQSSLWLSLNFLVLSPLWPMCPLPVLHTCIHSWTSLVQIFIIPSEEKFFLTHFYCFYPHRWVINNRYFSSVSSHTIETAEYPIKVKPMLEQTWAWLPFKNVLLPLKEDLTCSNALENHVSNVEMVVRRTSITWSSDM